MRADPSLPEILVARTPKTRAPAVFVAKTRKTRTTRLGSTIHSSVFPVKGGYQKALQQLQASKFDTFLECVSNEKRGLSERREVFLEYKPRRLSGT